MLYKNKLNKHYKKKKQNKQKKNIYPKKFHGYVFEKCWVKVNWDF